MSACNDAVALVELAESGSSDVVQSAQCQCPLAGTAGMSHASRLLAFKIYQWSLAHPLQPKH